MPTRWLLLVAAWSLYGAAGFGSDSWPQFRGPGGDGIWEGSTLPIHWSPDEHLAWKTRLPGVAWSQPVVSGSRVFVTTAITDQQQPPKLGESGPGFNFFSREGIARTLFNGAAPQVTYRWMVLCLDGATGDILWKQLAEEGQPTIPIHRSNTYASETPATDGERLIAHFGMQGLFCYDLDGELLWSRKLGTYPIQFGWGTGSSPVIHGQHVFVQCDNEEKSFLVALDKETGDESWRRERDERSNWATPYVWQNRLRTELVTAGGSRIRSYDPEIGTLLWELNAGGRAATTPVANEQLLIVGWVTRSTGRSEDLVAIRPGAADRIAEDAVGDQGLAWRQRRSAPELASPLLYGGCIYTLTQHGGVVTCLDAASGKRHYRERLPKAGKFTASPWANDGKIFCLDEDGRTFVLAAGPALEILSTNQLDDMFWSSAAVIGDRLLLRGVNQLYCISQ